MHERMPAQTHRQMHGCTKIQLSDFMKTISPSLQASSTKQKNNETMNVTFLKILQIYLIFHRNQITRCHFYNSVSFIRSIYLNHVNLIFNSLNHQTTIGHVQRNMFHQNLQDFLIGYKTFS